MNSYKQDIKEYSSDVFSMTKNWLDYFMMLLKWILLSIVIGGVIGIIAAGFSHAIVYVSALRESYPWLLFGMPVAGLFIIWTYKVTGQEKNSGTNLVLNVVRSEEKTMPGEVAPLILISTVLTHLVGGSSGREGAALQFGASVGDVIARHVYLSESDRKIMILAGMSAAFSALFGTPIAAAIFPMEVVSVGIMYYGALVPCVFSAFIAQEVAVLLKVRVIAAPYPVTNVPYFYSESAWKCVMLAICFAAAGMFFCISLHNAEHFFKKHFDNQYVRVVAGSMALILLRYVVGTDAYLGLGGESIVASFQEPQAIYAFLLKVLFTCLTLCVGFKGGEIVPSLFIGATLGSALAVLVGLPVGVGAACGMVGVFCSVTNCPISSMLISFELFGFDAAAYFCVTVAVCYLLSGYYSLYHSQKIVYSKTENKFINTKSS